MKQRSVISPLFFTLYVDELIDTLEHSGCGCKFGNIYYGILIYADDIFLLSPSAYGLQKMLTMCSSFANQNGLHFNSKKTQCIMFHHKQCVDTINELTLNWNILTWSHDITHLGHHFNCFLRKGSFIQCVNEICTEFAFAHPKCRAKLLQIHGTSFYGSNL